MWLILVKKNQKSLVKYVVLRIYSDGSNPRIGPGSARDRPFLNGLGSNFGEGPKLGIGSGLMSRIEGPEGPEDLL